MSVDVAPQPPLADGGGPEPGVVPQRWRRSSDIWVRYDKYFYGGLGVSILLLLWFVGTATEVLNPKFLAPPQDVFSELVTGLGSGGALREHVGPSLKRGLIGFGLGVLLGVSAGILVGAVRPLEKLFEPVLLFFRSLSILALFPVFLLFFGIGEESKIAIVTWAAFWPIFVNTTNAVKGVEKILINAARTLGASRTYVFTRVVLPAAIPNIFPGIRLGASYAFTALVAAEYLGATEGVGLYIRSSQEAYQIPAMYSGIVVLGLIGVALNLVLAGAERRITGWQHGLTSR